mmetsp:Transcript_34926/g.85885  ORF Transcript_34926/g.85885 Transcript_34926/m.85885 type:complete len:322 (+) Transcript_34926:264-1229(+)
MRSQDLDGAPQVLLEVHPALRDDPLGGVAKEVPPGESCGVLDALDGRAHALVQLLEVPEAPPDLPGAALGHLASADEDCVPVVRILVVPHDVSRHGGQDPLEVVGRREPVPAAVLDPLLHGVLAVLRVVQAVPRGRVVGRAPLARLGGHHRGRVAEGAVGALGPLKHRPVHGARRAHAGPARAARARGAPRGERHDHKPPRPRLAQGGRAGRGREGDPDGPVQGLRVARHREAPRGDALLVPPHGPHPEDAHAEHLLVLPDGDGADARLVLARRHEPPEPRQRGRVTLLLLRRHHPHLHAPRRHLQPDHVELVARHKQLLH